MLSIEFETPEHGWMPVKIIYKDVKVSFEVSDVPIDPISQLESVIDSSITGGCGEVWWHLEPAGYFLSIQAEEEDYRIKFEYSINSMDETRELVFEYLGSFDEVIVPLWRSLRKLQSYKWSEFCVSAPILDSITKQIKVKQKD